MDTFNCTRKVHVIFEINEPLIKLASPLYGQRVDVQVSSYVSWVIAIFVRRVRLLECYGNTN